MQTSEWGSSQWKFMHNIAFNYPINPTVEHKKYHKQYFESLGYILPCKYCRDSYQQYLKDISIDNYLDTRAGLIFFVYQLHDKVNQKLNKGSIPFKTMVRNYELMRARCKTGEYDRSNEGTFGKCLNPATNQINEVELDKFVDDTLNRYEYRSNNKCTKLYSDHVKYDNNAEKLLVLMLCITILSIVIYKKI
jgi:hypothetical protein